jgi:acyl-CoA reductase-like NAD-dependent aldehyde dehydrogenase
LKIINPTTEAVIQEVSEDTPASVAEKYKRARIAQAAWAKRPLKERIDAIRRFRDLAQERTEKLAATLTSEMGKPISQSRNELKALTGRIDFFIDHAEKTIGREVVLSDPAQKLEEAITHEPLGVIANISAWNYPYFVGSNVFVPALITGNTVLYKPSEFATLTGLAIQEMLHEAGVPKDAFVAVVGGGSVGAELLKQPINGVFFTGSYATGAKIAEAAARKMIKVQLELGGKDPIYVCDDVDVKSVAEATADGAFYNNGQSCCSVERIYVHAKVYDSFVEHFMNTVKGFVVGDPMDDKTYISALTRKPQLDILDHQVKDALAKGAKMLCGGKRMAGPNAGQNAVKTGYYYEPTVFTNVNHTLELMREESFGPIIGIQKVASDQEALELMNDTAYGLTAGVYTQDKSRATQLMSELNSGSVYWNCCDRVSPRLPWSGRGHSGIGSTLSTYGIQTFVQPKAWHLRNP